jgi:hypothetical protein
MLKIGKKNVGVKQYIFNIHRELIAFVRIPPLWLKSSEIVYCTNMNMNQRDTFKLLKYNKLKFMCVCKSKTENNNVFFWAKRRAATKSYQVLYTTHSIMLSKGM